MIGMTDQSYETIYIHYFCPGFILYKEVFFESTPKISGKISLVFAAITGERSFGYVKYFRFFCSIASGNILGFAGRPVSSATSHVIRIASMEQSCFISCLDKAVITSILYRTGCGPMPINSSTASSGPQPHGFCFFSHEGTQGQLAIGNWQLALLPAPCPLPPALFLCGKNRRG